MHALYYITCTYSRRAREAAEELDEEEEPPKKKPRKGRKRATMAAADDDDDDDDDDHEEAAAPDAEAALDVDASPQAAQEMDPDWEAPVKRKSRGGRKRASVAGSMAASDDDAAAEAAAGDDDPPLPLALGMWPIPVEEPKKPRKNKKKDPRLLEALPYDVVRRTCLCMSN